MKKRIKLTEDETGLEFLDSHTKRDITDDYIDKFMAVSKHITDFTNSKDFKQKDIADKLRMHESQLSKWLSGDHNLTLSSLLKLECACNIGIINPAILGEISIARPSAEVLVEESFVFDLNDYQAISLKRSATSNNEPQNTFFVIKPGQSTATKAQEANAA